MSADSEDVVVYCHARQRWLESQKRTQEVRSETADATRVTAELLRESMERNNVTCIRLPCASGTGAHFARLWPGKRRCVPLRTVEAVLELIDGASRHTADVPHEALPEAVARFVETRAREQGPIAPSRVRVLPRVPPNESVVECASAPKEVERLTTGFHEAHMERKKLQASLKPFQVKMKQAEKKLMGTLSDTPIAVQMSREGNHPMQTLQVSKAIVKSRAAPRISIGIRMVRNAIRELVPGISRSDEFDSILKSKLRTYLEGSIGTRPPRSRIVVRPIPTALN